MKSAVILFLAFVLAAIASRQQDPPRIWALTEGEDHGIGGGFDIVDEGKILPWVFKYTYAMGRTSTIGTTNYLVPDGISAASIRQFIGQNQTRVLTSWSDYLTYSLKTTNFNANLNFENVTMTMAYQGTKGNIKQLTKNGTNNFGFQGGIYLSFSLMFRGLQRPALDDDFAYDVKHLPVNYDAAAYGSFIKAWGTHYYSRATYGCQYNITASFDHSYSEKKGSQWSTSQLDLTLKFNMIDFGLKKASEVNKSQIDGGFLDNAQVTATAKGGDETKFVMGKDFDGWLESCVQNKVALSLYSDLEPLTTLITDPRVRANLAKAIIYRGTTGKFPQ